MSEQDKNDAARGWRYVEKLLAEEDKDGAPEVAFSADELMAAADAKLAARKAEAANPPLKVPPPAASPPAVVTVVRTRRRWTRAVAVAGALAAGAMLYLAATPPQPVGHAPPDFRAMAEKARDVAEESCAARQWVACARALDRARGMDPDGEDEPRVKKARGEIAAGVAGVGTDGG